MPELIPGQAPTIETPAPVADPTPKPEGTPAPVADPKVYDEAYVKALRGENAAARVKLKEFTDAEETRKQADMTEAQKLTARAEAAEARAKALEIAQVRTKAAAKHGLPDDLHEFITAEDATGAEAQALKLAEKLKPANGLPQAGNRNPANGGDAAARLDEATRLKSLVSQIPSLHNHVLKQ